MTKMNCTNCRNNIATDQILICHTCGNLMCDYCSSETGGICKNCYSDMKYYC